jgi:hypothetical protein
MSNAIQGLKKALAASREANRQLKKINSFLSHHFEENIMSIVSKDFPSVNEKVQEWAEIAKSYKCNILTALGWEVYPSSSFQVLLEKIREINPELAEELDLNGINFSILGKGDSDPQTGWVSPHDICVSLSNWDEDIIVNKIFNKEIKSVLDDFASDFEEEIKSVLQKNNLAVADLKQYLLEEDFLTSPVLIKEIDGNSIWTDKGFLICPSKNQDIWDFIDENRGQLVGLSQIVNPEMLPFSLGKVFAIA